MKLFYKSRIYSAKLGRRFGEFQLTRQSRKKLSQYIYIVIVVSKIHNKNAFVPLYFVYETAAVTVTTSLLSFFSISSTLHTETNTYISFRKGDTFLCILECQFDELCCMNKFRIFAPINSLDFSFSKRIFISIHFLKFAGFYFFTLHSNFHLLLHSV